RSHLPLTTAAPLILNGSLTTPPHHPFPTRRSSDLPATFSRMSTAEAPEAAGDGFRALGLSEKLLDALTQLGYEELLGQSKRAKPDRKSTRLNSSHEWISYAVFCLKNKRRLMRNNTR